MENHFDCGIVINWYSSERNLHYLANYDSGSLRVTVKLSDYNNS